MAREVRSHRIEFFKKRFGVAKWHYKRLDCIDLYIELLILVNYQFIREYRPCRHLLKFVVDVLRNKWDDIRFIDFEEALHLANYLKALVPFSVILQHFTIKRRLLKKMISKARIEKKTT